MMIRRYTWLVALCVWAVAAGAVAQSPACWVATGPCVLAQLAQVSTAKSSKKSDKDKKDSSKHSSKTYSSDEIRARVEKYQRLLESVDRNHNGLLDRDEVEHKYASLVQKLADRAGMSPQLPLSIAKLCEGVKRYYESGGNPAPVASQPARYGTTTSDVDPAVLVPGFGAAAGDPVPPGFGEPDEESSGAAQPASFAGQRTTAPSQAASPAPAKPSKPAESSSKEDKKLQERYRRYAGSLLRQYDKNGSGKLEREEWRGMRGDPQKADRNGDGVITVDELTSQLVEYSKRRRSEGADDRGGGSGADPDDRKSYRFRSPRELLPDGLPSWFTSRDANGDGQVSMAEYATEWNSDTVAEFVQRDDNDDGIITAEECLQFEKDR